MKWSPLPDGLLLIEGNTSFLLVGRAERSFSLYIETSHEEYIQEVDPDDLVVVSSPEGGPYEPAIMLLELVRTYHIPLIVLPQDHPGSRRLKLVVAVAPRVTTSCSIVRGTHPEQHLLCSSEEMAGISLIGDNGEIVGENIPGGAVIRHLPRS
ncbi:MAG: alpha/beta hydrolase [Methanomicrobiales archaeon]|nr:alpha/beta hydrolase [Methanomicrobiales archaeon]